MVANSSSTACRGLVKSQTARPGPGEALPADLVVAVPERHAKGAEIPEDRPQGHQPAHP
jgi:hypothetical protein